MTTWRTKHDPDDPKVLAYRLRNRARLAMNEVVKTDGLSLGSWIKCVRLTETTTWFEFSAKGTRGAARLLVMLPNVVGKESIQRSGGNVIGMVELAEANHPKMRFVMDQP